MKGPAIEAEGLTKRFGKERDAVRDLTIRIRPGTAYGLLGRNGAGKSTFLRLCMGLLRPDEGRVRVLGSSMWEAARQLRERVAYVSQLQQVHNWMTVAELCRYAGAFYSKWDAGYARQLIERWELPPDCPAGRLSGGEQRKACLVLAFAARPQVMILDEPFAGLDAIARRALLDEMIALMTREECTVLFSTHMVADLERVAEYVGVMHDGELKESVRLEDLQNSTRRVQVIFEGETVPPFQLPGEVWSERRGPVLTAVCRLASEAQLDPIRYLSGVRVQTFPMGLEEIFITLFGGRAGRAEERLPGRSEEFEPETIHS